MKFLLLVFMLFLAVFGPCERRTKVSLSGGNPPIFIMSGSGNLEDLIIYGPKQRDVSSDRSFALWEIEPINGLINGRAVEDIGSIKYGVVPQGYKQVYPEHGSSPPQLVVGEKYEYWFQTINARHARAYFEIRDNKAVELPK